MGECTKFVLYIIVNLPLDVTWLVFMIPAVSNVSPVEVSYGIYQQGSTGPWSGFVGNSFKFLLLKLELLYMCLSKSIYSNCSGSGSGWGSGSGSGSGSGYNATGSGSGSGSIPKYWIAIDLKFKSEKLPKYISSES